MATNVLAAHPAGFLTGVRPFGAHARLARVGQSFTVERACYITAITLLMQPAASPTDNLQLTVLGNYSSLPTYVPPFGAPIFSDTFTDDDNTTLYAHDSNWVTQSGALKISGNKLVNNVAGGVLTHASVETGTLHQTIVADLTMPAAPVPASGATDWAFGLIGRHVKGTQTFYEGRILFQNNVPEVEIFAFVAGTPYRQDGSTGGADLIVQHNSMLRDTLVPGETTRLTFDLNGRDINLYWGTATAPATDGTITPTTYVGSSAPNGWTGVTVSQTLYDLILGTRAGVIQDAIAEKAGIWDNFAVYPANVANTSATVAASSLRSLLVPVRFVFPTPVHAQAGVHWFSAKRSGSADVTNHYLVGVDGSGGYTGGSGARWDSTLATINDAGGQPSIRSASPFWRTTSEDLIFWVEGFEAGR